MSRASELARLLYLSAESVDGNADRCHITGLEHSLRVATLAKRYCENHKLNQEMVFVGLVHDLARPLSNPFHGEVIAEIVRDMVSETSYHVLRTHGDYQSAHNHGYKLDSTVPWHPEASALCAWELSSFSNDWRLDTMDLSEALDLIDAVCAGRD